MAKCTKAPAERPIHDEKLECLFEKKFKYIKTSEWSLPPHTELFQEYYQFENFQELKSELNDVKSKLNNYVIEEWSVHTRKKDPAGEIPWKLKNEIEAEFVTVAWCKLFECLHQYKIVKNGRMNSLHLCEAPGAFIAALNHYLHSTYDEVDWKWRSTTLNPYYEGNPCGKMIMDDRFMLHTLDRWLFYEDFTGNLIDCNNIHNLVKKCNEILGDVHLISADGSVDCINTPDDQESFVSSLHFAEICSALLILAKGGSFVLKMFTLFESLSISLVYFLNCVFDEVNVFKPATSKRGNSEVYLICLDYKKPDNITDYLKLMMNQMHKCLILPLFLKTHIPHDFITQHEVCTRRFMHEQINAIESNIYSYELKSRWSNKQNHELRSKVCQIYMERYKVKPLAPEKTILQSPQSKIQRGIKMQFYRGSYTERLYEKVLPINEQIFHLRKALNEIEKVIIWRYEEIAFFRRTSNLPLNIFKGKPLKEICSSLFVSPEIFILRSKIVSWHEEDPIFIQDCHCILEENVNKIDKCLVKFDKHPISQRQREFFFKILQHIIDQRPKRIHFVKLPFLTHYGVSILWYLVSNIYDTCRIFGNGTITLEMENDFDEETIDSVRHLHNELTTLNSDLEVMCVADISYLHRTEFAKAIIEFNNQLLMKNYAIMLYTKR